MILAQWCYTPGFSQTATTTPSAILSDDFNNDGKMDVLVGVNNRVLIYVGNGAGLFSSSVAINTAGQIISLASAHLNADPYKDFIFLIQSGNAMVALGSASGSFAISGGYPGCTNPLSVLTDDFNNDSFQDLIITDGCSPAFHRYIGNGAGGFATSTSSILVVNGGNYSTDGVSGDFNADGFKDLILTNGSTNDVSVYLGASGNSFQAVTKYTVGTYPMSLDKGDFNMDGKLDIATANYNADSVSVLFGNGSGGFSPAIFYKVNANPKDLKAADLNGDGYLDIAVCNYSNNSVYVLPGTSGGVFLSTLSFTTGSQPTGVALADFNGDNKLDMMSCDRNSNTLSFWLSNYPNPFIAGSQSVCLNSPATFSAGNLGASTFTWSNGSTSPQIQFNVVSNTVISITATNSLNCSGTASLAITTLTLPGITVSSSSSLICKGESVVLNGFGANTYTWNNGNNNSSIQPTLNSTTTFTLNGSGSNGCTNRVVYTQSVSACTQLVNSTLVNKEILVFPNPANDLVTITLGEVEFLELNIYNTLGQNVHHEVVIESTQLNISNYKRGIYIYTLSETNQVKHSGILVFN